ncbi:MULTISPECIES: AraC family transcriptional regulator [Nocardia]|uniref:AraC family transcriptional regulator n=1 Tax=Nocardia salmonicida TaxID=53431 RepID=A0ABZ1NEP5_9NOCA|nr:MULTISPECIES: AraC family transcriptional regulator [Nocardia]KQY31558.1 cupin [Nocardia sp. Root136]
MDPLSSLLSGIRAEGSIVAHTVLRPPWTIRFADRAPLIMVTVLRGGGTLVLPDGSRSCLVAGDTALVQAGEPFHLADTAAALDRPHTRYELSCFVPDGFGPADISCATPELIVTPSTTGAPEETSLLVGAYRAAGRRHERLLRALPQVMVVHEDAETCLWLEQSAADAVRLSAGSQALMDRLLDWALVCTLRSWLAEQQHCAPAWYRGMSDPVVGPALSAIHDRPFDRWTVASLATEAAVSRALFARRFTEVMGEPPLAYLTEWRMAEAEELLADPARSVAQVATTVGYSDAFGFSAAFKRLRGTSPTEFRVGLSSSA